MIDDSGDTLEETEGEVATAQVSPSYHIDLSWFERANRSFSMLAQARMCEACREKLGTEEEVNEPVVDKKRGKVVFKKKKVAFGSNPFVVIRDCCSKARDYIRADQPLLEIVFRLLLASANQPLSAERLHEQLIEWLGSALGTRDVPTAKLQRVLDADRFYGIQRLDLPEAGALET
ncbi:MAG: hypothetical protein HYX92_00485 [Chloroflexi bacterium]|nr:hypothetical protein [Chloroflexota bacterium]